MKAIINANVVMRDYVIQNGVILIDGDKIISVGKASKVSVPKEAEIIDAEYNYVGPGLIDIHTHAAAKTYFIDDPKKCSEDLLRHGVTSVLPALYYSLDKENFLNSPFSWADTIVSIAFKKFSLSKL